MGSKSFTIIELLVTIAIIGLLVALLIPNIDRSLSKNQIVNDVDLFKAKLEETRLLAGSTQQIDESSNNIDPNDPSADEVGYYAIVIPRDDSTYFNIVKMSHPVTNGLCTADKVINNINNNIPDCIVERVNLSKNITLSNRSNRYQFIVFRVPTQQISTLELGANWEVVPLVFDNPVFELRYLDPAELTATINIDSYTGRVTASYE